MITNLKDLTDQLCCSMKNIDDALDQIGKQLELATKIISDSTSDKAKLYEVYGDQLFALEEIQAEFNRIKQDNKSNAQQIPKLVNGFVVAGFWANLFQNEQETKDQEGLHVPTQETVEEVFKAYSTLEGRSLEFWMKAYAKHFESNSSLDVTAFHKCVLELVKANKIIIQSLVCGRDHVYTLCHETQAKSFSIPEFLRCLSPGYTFTAPVGFTRYQSEAHTNSKTLRFWDYSNFVKALEFYIESNPNDSLVSVYTDPNTNAKAYKVYNYEDDNMTSEFGAKND